MERDYKRVRKTDLQGNAGVSTEDQRGVLWGTTRFLPLIDELWTHLERLWFLWVQENLALLRKRNVVPSRVLQAQQETVSFAEERQYL